MLFLHAKLASSDVAFERLGSRGATILEDGREEWAARQAARLLRDGPQAWTIPEKPLTFFASDCIVLQNKSSRIPSDSGIFRPDFDRLSGCMTPQGRHG